MSQEKDTQAAISRVVGLTDQFGRAFWQAKSDLNVLDALDYDANLDSYTEGDGTFPSPGTTVDWGSLDGVSPEDVRIVLQEVLPGIETLLSEASSINPNRTKGNALNRVRAASR